jgi:hypothetical protein
LVAVPASDDAAAREVVVDGRDGRVVVANGHERDAIATELVRAGVAALLDPSAEGIGAALARPTAR